RNWPSSTICSSWPASAAMRATPPAAMAWPRPRSSTPAGAYSIWKSERTMIPSYSGLNTALSGLEAAQAAIDTTGQNIANANTPGYSRQQVVMTERNPLTIPSLSSVTGNGSQLGLGVDITTVTRLHHPLPDLQYR